MAGRGGKGEKHLLLSRGLKSFARRQQEEKSRETEG